MNQVTKNIAKEIKELAAKLPTSYYEAPAQSGVLGKELLKLDVKEFQGQPIDPKKFYTVKEDFLFPVNHNRQLRKAFELDGKNGIVEYVKGQNAIHRPQPLASFPSVQW